jgi:hypothetical protein
MVVHTNRHKALNSNPRTTEKERQGKKSTKMGKNHSIK